MTPYVKPLSDGSMQLCCGGVNCPTVHKVGDDMIEIRDDNGKTVTIKKAQAQIITAAVNRLDESSELLLG